METNSVSPISRNGCARTSGAVPKMMSLAPYGMPARIRKMKIGPRKTMGWRRRENSSFSPVWDVYSCLSDISEGEVGDGRERDGREPVDPADGLPGQEEDDRRSRDEDEAGQEADRVARAVLA